MSDVLAAAQARAAALARDDQAELRRLLHPSFGWVSHPGETFDLEGYLAANAGGPRVSQTLEDVEVVTVADAAVLRCIAVDEVDGERFGMPMTQVWTREGGRWRCVAGHAGPRLIS